MSCHVMLCLLYNICYIIIMCHVMLYNTCHVMLCLLYNICDVMLYNMSCQVIEHVSYYDR